MDPVIVQTSSAEETMRLGAWLGQQARPGWVIGLSGDLGAGKTTLVKGIAEGAGAGRDEVTSPTFTFLHVYHGRLEVHHMDLYRLDSPEQVRDLGVEEYLGGQGVAVVEWFENVPGVLPEPRLEMRIRNAGPGAAEDAREIALEAKGEGWDELLEKAKTWRS